MLPRRPLLCLIHCVVISQVMTSPGRHRNKVHPESRSEHLVAPPMNYQAHVQQELNHHGTVHNEQATTPHGREAPEEPQFITPRLQRIAENARVSRSHHAPSTGLQRYETTSEAPSTSCAQESDAAA